MFFRPFLHVQVTLKRWHNGRLTWLVKQRSWVHLQSELWDRTTTPRSGSNFQRHCYWDCSLILRRSMFALFKSFDGIRTHALTIVRMTRFKFSSQRISIWYLKLKRWLNIEAKSKGYSPLVSATRSQQWERLNCPKKVFEWKLFEFIEISSKNHPTLISAT